MIRLHPSRRLLLAWLALGPLLIACPTLPSPQCLLGRSESGAFLIQLRPRAAFPAACPQGQQYQMLLASQYGNYGTEDPQMVLFQLAGSNVEPISRAQATGKFTTFGTPPSSDDCTIETLTPAVDDGVTPVNAPTPVGATTYLFSRFRVLSDAVHRGNQVEGRALVDYGTPGCSGLEYVAQGVFPITPCIDDTICLPDQVVTDAMPPAGRALGSQLNPDYRAFCNLDPALLDNAEISSRAGVGRNAYLDTQGNAHDVGICFYSEPFPSLCPAGSTLSTSGPCVVGPGSNPH